MNESNLPSSLRPRRPAWNKGKMPGPKPALRPGHVWAIRAKLQLEKRTRDLAMFNLAIDSKLRGCDLVDLRVDNVAPNGYAVDRATIRQTDAQVQDHQTMHLIPDLETLWRGGLGNVALTASGDQNATTQAPICAALERRAEVYRTSAGFLLPMPSKSVQVRGQEADHWQLAPSGPDWVAAAP